METASQAVANQSQHTATPPELAVKLSFGQRCAAVLRALFWAIFGVAGHLVLALLGLLVAVAILLSPILVLGALIEMISWLLP